MSVYLFAGDSIVSSDRFETDDNLGTGFVKMLSEELEKSGEHIVFNRGYDGHTVSQMLRHKDDFMTMRPDVVTLLIGINDVCEHIYASGPDEKCYVAGIRELIREWKKTASDIILIEPFLFPVPEEYRNWFPVLARFCEALRALSKEESLLLIPMWDIFQEKMKKQDPGELTKDGIHPNEQGHIIIADAWREKNIND